jgi:hypothetical protein
LAAAANAALDSPSNAQSNLFICHPHRVEHWHGFTASSPSLSYFTDPPILQGLIKQHMFSGERPHINKSLDVLHLDADNT